MIRPGLSRHSFAALTRPYDEHEPREAAAAGSRTRTDGNGCFPSAQCSGSPFPPWFESPFSMAAMWSPEMVTLLSSSNHTMTRLPRGLSPA